MKMNLKALLKMDREQWKQKVLEIKEYLVAQSKFYRWTSLDRYTLAAFLASLFASLFFFIAIYELAQIFQGLRSIPNGTNFWLVFQFYFFEGIYNISMFEQFSFLFATIYVLSRMAQHRELVAIISTGTSMFRASFYLIAFTAVYYILLVTVVQNTIIFPSYQKREMLAQIIFNKVDPKTLDHLKDNSNFSIFGANNLIYIIGFYNATTKEMNNVTIVQLKPGVTNTMKGLPESTNQNYWLLTNVLDMTKQRNLIYPEMINISLRIDAQKGFWDPKDKKWKFQNGSVHYVREGGEEMPVETFTEKSFNFVIDPPYYFEKVWYSIEAMTYQEGKKFIDKLKKSRQDYKGNQAKYLMKFSYPLGILFIVLAGIGLVDLSRRKVSFVYNLLLSMGIFVLYFLIFSYSVSMASKGFMPPIIGAYLGTVVFGVMSIYLFRNVKT